MFISLVDNCNEAVVKHLSIMYQDAYNLMHEILKDSVISSIEFCKDGSIICKNNINGSETFENMQQVLEFHEECPF